MSGGFHGWVVRMPTPTSPDLCAIVGSRQNGQHGMGPAEAATARWWCSSSVRSGRAMLPQSPQHVGTRTSSVSRS